MTALELRAEILQLLDQEENLSVLEAIRMLLRREDPKSYMDGVTDAEYAQFNEAVARYEKEGKGFLGEEEFFDRMRSAAKDPKGSA